VKSGRGEKVKREVGERGRKEKRWGGGGGRWEWGKERYRKGG